MSSVTPNDEQILMSLVNHVEEINIPQRNSRVYKDECVYSFRTPYSDGGIYLCLKTLYGVSKEFLEYHHLKTASSIYLFMKFKKTLIEPTANEQQPTRLGIGIEGGFNTDVEKKFNVEKYYEVVIFPSFQRITWPNSNLPDKLNKAIEAVIKAESVIVIIDTEDAWDGEVRVVSKYSDSLPQLNNNKKIPPSGWKCEKCDLTTNLWLNLTDGSILCGRKFFDGTGGNNHAVQHYNETHYPLAVKLGTITKEGKADVYSYEEDDMVNDANLVEHLAHFGINILNMEKSEKSMIELELDLNQKFGEWVTIQEAGSNLKPLYGPGYTGLTNLGNSCYMNSTMQVIFTIPDFVRKYVDNSKVLYEQSTGSPVEDFNIQMAKLGNGLLSGDYSKPPENPYENTYSISPHMFKTVVGKGHPYFSTKKQQDVQEFFLHIISLVQRTSRNQTDPADCFKIKVEDRFQCLATSKVQYTYRTEYCLPVSIPMEEVINKDELEQYEQISALEKEQGSVSKSQPVKPKYKFSSCLDAFIKPEIIDQFYSTALKTKTQACKITKISEFPQYLVIHLKKYYLGKDWIPMKLDVSVEMPDVIDLLSLRGTGIQSDEQLLPDNLSEVNIPAFQFNEEILTHLLDLGYPENMCKRAIYNTKNQGVESASNWIMSHLDDPNISDTFIVPDVDMFNFEPDKDSLDFIMSMGFTQNQAFKALKETENNTEQAIDWIFSHPEESSVEEMDTSRTADSDSNDQQNSCVTIDDGSTRYRLKAFISHMGSSTMVGHYVCHIFRDNQWVIYNDEKVALSENPPKDFGYLYFYERF